MGNADEGDKFVRCCSAEGVRFALDANPLSHLFIQQKSNTLRWAANYLKRSVSLARGPTAELLRRRQVAVGRLGGRSSRCDKALCNPRNFFIPRRKAFIVRLGTFSSIRSRRSTVR